jgi:hypothetical protein
MCAIFVFLSELGNDIWFFKISLSFSFTAQADETLLYHILAVPVLVSQVSFFAPKTHGEIKDSSPTG